MKQFFPTATAVILLIALSGFISGCSGGSFTDPGSESGGGTGSGSTSSSPLVGTWTSSEAAFTFNANRTGSMTYYGDDELESFSGTFTWTVSGNTLKMTGSSGSTKMEWSVNGNTLTLTGFNDEGELILDDKPIILYKGTTGSGTGTGSGSGTGTGSGTGSGSNTSSSSLVGTWSYTAGTSTETFTFNSGGSGSKRITYSSSSSASQVLNFTWTVSGNTLTLKPTGGGSTTMKWSVSGNTLTLTTVSSSGVSGASQTYKKS